ncbi:hypothetical protein GCM10010246_57860 [Streptomyces cuspidosporus]|uniref:Uncharacterized protein n=1 Tax=Streptomyces cuspidosporus TaxID=66882 RepID=A0ABN3GSR7_9ACTN
MVDDGWIDRAASRGADRGGEYAEANRRAQEVATVHVRLLGRTVGQSDIGRGHSKPISDERQHIDVPGGLPTTLQPADGALAVSAQVGQLLLGPPTSAAGGRDGLTRVVC